MNYVAKMTIIIFFCVLSGLFAYIMNLRSNIPCLTGIQLSRTYIDKTKSRLSDCSLSILTDQELEHVAPYLVMAEDRYFFHYDAIDWKVYNERVKSFINDENNMNGSGITQQLAKNLFFAPKRSVFRKILEVPLSYILDWSLGKRRILRIYAQSIEFGPGVYGIKSAAKYYYHKNINDLNEDEMIRIVGVLPLPLKISPINIENSILSKRYMRLQKISQLEKDAIKRFLNE